MWIGDRVISNLSDVMGSLFLYLSDPLTFDFFYFFGSLVVGDGHFPFPLILCWIDCFILRPVLSIFRKSTLACLFLLFCFLSCFGFCFFFFFFYPGELLSVFGMVFCLNCALLKI